MIQTYLFLTQTSLELSKIQQNLAQNFFDKDKIEINSNPVDQNLWEKHRNSGQIILFEPTDLGTDSKKETFKKFLQNDVWISYAKPTLLFLGDLSQYSESLQEGMLKLLEEPPVNLIIIIFAQNLSRIKPTIISRSRIQTIPLQIVFQNLNPKIIEKVKKLPEPSIVVKNLLGNIKTEVDKVSDYEREEIDMWLWQIETNLGMIYKEKPENKIAESVTKVLKARQLNDQNLQKKFSIGWLNT
jgi:DNA polymerase III, delta subunit